MALSGPNMMQLRVYTNYRDSGYSEGFNLGPGSYTGLEPNAVLIVNAIARLLPAGFTIPHAVMSDLKTLRESMVVSGFTYTGDVLDAEPVFATDSLCNDPEVSFLVRWGDGNGKYSNRHIRGLRDGWVVDNKSTLALAAPYAINGPYMNALNPPPDPVYAPGDASTAVINNLLSIIRDKSVLLDPVTKTPGLGSYSYTPFLSWNFRRVSSKDVGYRFAGNRGRQAAWA